MVQPSRQNQSSCGYNKRRKRRLCVGREEGRIRLLVKWVKAGRFNVKEAAEEAGMSAERFQKILDEIQLKKINELLAKERSQLFFYYKQNYSSKIYVKF